MLRPSVWEADEPRPFDPLEIPRVAFVGAPVPFKAYLLHETAKANLVPEADPALELAAAVLPLIDTGTVSSP